jgi:hypothetical protein
MKKTKSFQCYQPGADAKLFGQLTDLWLSGSQEAIFTPDGCLCRQANDLLVTLFAFDLYPSAPTEHYSPSLEMEQQENFDRQLA